MLIFSDYALVFANNTEPGAIYYLNEPLLPWLWPALIILGLAAQAAAIFLKNRIILVCGGLSVLAGAVPERDISVVVGIIIVSATLWVCLKRR